MSDLNDRNNGSPRSTAELGARIRELRTQAGMSLRDLAAATNLTPSSISQIERGLSGGTSKSLFALANALGVSPGAFFEREQEEQQPPTVKEALSTGLRKTIRANRAEADPSRHHPSLGPSSRLTSAVVRGSSRKSITIDGNEAPIEWQLLTVHPDARGDFIEVVYHPGASSSPGESFMQHVGWDYVLVLSGELTVSLAFEHVVLGPGDSMSFDSTIPHRLENQGTEPCRSIWFVLRSH